MNFYEWFFLEKDRAPAGLFSWSHLLSVSIIFIGFVVLGFFLAKKYKDNPKGQRIVLIITSAFLLTLVLMKIIFLLATSDDVANTLLENLPLFFCDMMYFIIPIAAFSKGKVQDICFDFIAICGFMMGIMGNYFAGNIYVTHPAISYLSLINSFIHSIYAFAAMFIFKAHLNKMEKRNIPFTIGVLVIYMSIALLVDYLTGKNFMFLIGGSDTPFEIIFSMVKGNLIIYQIILYVLQCGYIGLFYLVYHLIIKLISKRKAKQETNNE